MSYLALARKWRPRRFEDVRGQPHVVQALQNALARDRLHPAILLTGTRGVGKTTLARIIAKGLNCETGVSAQPCGVCSACREVNDGRFVDLLEIDAASNTGVDDVRALIDNAQYAPARGRYKVYLIDEVHMLSKSAFNALLKTLEEPPPHVKFILATTDPQKLPVTVLSRCLQFSLKRLPAALIREALAEILGQEAVEFEPAALAEIARSADGSMRDALSLLDQAIAFAGGGRLQQGPIEEMLGTVGRRTLLELLQALAAGDGAALLAGLRKLDEAAPDYAALLNELAARLQRIAVLQVLPPAGAAGADDDDAPLLPLAGTVPAEDVQLWYQVAVLARRDLPWAPDPRLGFEMALLRMLAFRPEPAGLGPVSYGRDSKPAARSAAPAAAPAAAPPSPAPARPRTERPAPAAPPTTIATPLPPAAAAMPEQPAVPVAPQSQEWAQRLDTLGLEGMTRQLARHCAWAGESGDTLRLALEPRARHLLTEERRLAVQRALSAQAGRPLQLEVAVQEAPDLHSPVALDERRAAERQRDAEAAVEEDPTVRALRESFGASVRPGSVRPLEDADNGA